MVIWSACFCSHVCSPRVVVNMSLKVYGVAPSQPTRAVMFLLAIKNIPYELVKVSPATPRSTRKDYINNINPTGKIPGFKDDEEGVILYESPAIMTYIATKYKMEDLYPSNDLKRRALIDQYLHFHHENTRKVTTGFIAPLLRADVKLDAWNPDTLKLQRKLATYSINIVENNYLSSHKFIIDDNLSLADILCYEELLQIKRWDLIKDSKNKYPNIYAWFERMEKLPNHDKVHRIMAKLDKFMLKRLNECKPLLSKL